jgi:hypothetical protein
MHLDKHFVLDELKKEGQSEKVQHALNELPDRSTTNSTPRCC